MELFPFQIKASTEIASKFAEYSLDPLTITRTRILPFYQNLNSLTGSGKTLVLADAISQMRSQLAAEPIVLWLSKGKVVVWPSKDESRKPEQKTVCKIGKYRVVKDA